MGLDVYLYRYDDFAATSAAEEEASRFSEEIWERVTADVKYEALTDAAKEEARTTVTAHNATLGLDEWGIDKTRKRKIEIDSTKYPEHLFKIGYFRSSYNQGGFDHIAGDLVGLSLSDVFAVDDEYEFTPDWDASRVRTLDLLTKLSSAPRLRVATMDAVSLFGPATKRTAAEAIQVLLAEQARKSPFGDGSYSSSNGTFFGTPFAILAAIPGAGILGNPAVHLVYEDKDFDWYIHAAEIVVETIDWVIAQPDRAKYVLHWSS